MYPMQMHEIRSIAQAEALRSARKRKMAGAIQLRRPRSLSFLIARLSPVRQDRDCAAAAPYAPSPC